MRQPADMLATKLWRRNAIAVSGATSDRKFAAKMDAYASTDGGYGLDLRLIAAWKAGRYAVSEGTVRRVENCVPGTMYVYLVGQLIKPQHLSAPAVLRHVSDLIEKSEDKTSWCWRLPGAVAGQVVTYRHNDAQSLMERGDFYSVVTLLALLRMSIARSGLGSRLELLAHLYCSLVAAARLPWVLPDLELLLDCITAALEAKACKYISNQRLNWTLFWSCVAQYQCAAQAIDPPTDQMIQFFDSGGRYVPMRLGCPGPPFDDSGPELRRAQDLGTRAPFRRRPFGPRPRTPD